MNPNRIQNYQTTSKESNQSGDGESFNFDLWAREVKRQMIASLRKREQQD
ncbi:MAG TPA: hypothetical protein V6C78_03610 [Crinalium sp.]|jgi:hypothetical protein